MAKESTVIVLEQRLVKSRAWLSLTGMAPQVYLIFRTKCQISHRLRKSGRKGERVILNNGQIIFTYDEAEEKYGMTAPRFGRAINQLIDRGFINVTGTGMGVYKVTTTYAISDRWQDWGTARFEEAKRPAPSIRNCGFKKGNEEWKKARRKSPSDVCVHGAVNTDVHGSAIAVNNNVHSPESGISRNSLEVENLCAEIAQVRAMNEDISVL